MADYVVGVTGGIGSGKSAVSDRFETLGVEVVDADVAARRVVEPGQPGLGEIVDHFGAEVLQADGQLDRPALRARVFRNSAQRRWLERALHPRINALMRDELICATSPYAILANPLMRNRDARADRILVVDVPEGVQIRRTMARDHVGEAQAKAIMASQLDRNARLAFADDVIVNDGSIENLQAAVDALHPRYLELAVAKCGTRR